MAYKRLFWIGVGALTFAIAFSATYLIQGSSTPHQFQAIPMHALDKAHLLAREVSQMLEADEPAKSEEISKLLASDKYGSFQLLYLDWSIKIPERREDEPIASEFISHVGDTLRIMIPVGENRVKGVLHIDLPVESFQPNGMALHERFLFGLSVALMVYTLLFWLRARKLIRPVDKLCQNFTRYRIEQESTYLELPEEKEYQTAIERRVTILQDLWNKFLATQEQLNDKVDELERSKRKLEQTIQDLERAKIQEQRLVELGYALAEFGHDIGNSNGSIRTYADLLLQTLEKDSIQMMDVVRALTVVRRIRLASESVAGLTSDILEFAKGKTDLRLSQVRIENLIAQLEVNLGFADDIPIEFEYSSMPEKPIKLDESKMVRVVVNLVKNAWEKLQEEEEPLITIRFEPEPAGGTWIHVHDNGSPIPATILPRLFQSFQTQGKEKGTGLGLAICKKIVQAHGGSITAENVTHPKGVQFSVFIPANGESPRAKSNS